MTGLASTPEPPYYAVIFVSRGAADTGGYPEAAERMIELASVEPGFLGIDSARSDGVGITVSYWRSEAAIEAWKWNVEHAAVRDEGRTRWYDAYELRVARVERAYDWQR